MYRILLMLLLAALAACTNTTEEPVTKPEAPAQVAEPAPAPYDPTMPPVPDAIPPTPPISEDFEGEPKLSLFPRIVDFKPEDDEKERMEYWYAFMEHVVRTSGVRVVSQEPPNRALLIKSIDTIDSVAFFSPLAVSPQTTYKFDFRFKGDIPEKGEAGIAILEFSQFLWLGEQYPKSIAEKYQVNASRLVDLKSSEDWREESLTFTSGPDTRMIHLIFFRDGQDGKVPVFFDGISIAEEPAGS